MLHIWFARRSLGRYQVVHQLPILCRYLSASTTQSEGPSEEEHREARTWLARFNVNTIPKNVCEITFSRSSGPGGQNVNKVNSKATLRIHTKDFLHLVPKSLVIQGDGSRSRTDNMQECYKKLHALIVAAGRSTVRGETSPQQVERVKKLQHKENEMRLQSKKTHGNKKAARRGFPKGSGY